MVYHTEEFFVNLNDLLGLFPWKPRGDVAATGSSYVEARTNESTGRR
jgi:hypothetical protein